MSDRGDDLHGEDRMMATSLRRAASDIAGTIDTDEALERVRARARARRHHGRRLLTAAVGAAAAAVVLVVLLTVSGDDRQVLRTPATQPVTTDGRATASAPITSSPPTSSALTPTATASTSLTTAAPLATPAQVVPPATATTPVPGATTIVAPPATTTYHSTGGSIVVRADGDALTLYAPPEPTPGWSFRIDDDGPARVRVRFELDDRRSEIRVDLVDGQPVPRITED